MLKLADGSVERRILDSMAAIAQRLHGPWMAAQVNAVLGVNFVERNARSRLSMSSPPSVRVAVGVLDFKNAVAQLEDGNIEGAAARS